MIKRIVEIGSPARLSLKRKQLQVEREEFAAESLPVEDLGVLILDHPAICPSQGLLSECMKNNVAVVMCDEKHLPASVLLPLDGHTLHSKIVKEQAAATPGRLSRLWRAIVREKILAQADTLDAFEEYGEPLRAIAGRAGRENPAQAEARAARMYWPRMFGTDFRRNRALPGVNRLLNYGYSLIRAATARAVVAAGLHPAFGLHHHNQYDGFCLADDLMEPLRPLVDRRVRRMRDEPELWGEELELEKEEKRELLSVLAEEVRFGGKTYPLLTALQYYAAGVRRVVCGEEKETEIPRP